MTLYQMYNDSMLLQDLILKTFILIKDATSVAAIKKVIEVYDVLNLSNDILLNFNNSDIVFDDLYINDSMLRYLNTLRCSIMVEHAKDFNSIIELNSYNKILAKFLNVMKLKLENLKD